MESANELNLSKLFPPEYKKHFFIQENQLSMNINDKKNLMRTGSSIFKNTVHCQSIYIIFKSEAYRLVSVFFLIKKFIFQIRRINSVKILKSFNKKTITFINDLAFFANEMNIRRSKFPQIVTPFSKKIENLFKELSDKLLLDHFSSLVAVLNLLLFLCYLYNIFLIPINYAHSEVNEFFEKMNFIFIAIMTIKMIVKLNTSFLNSGEINKNRNEIVLNYFKADLVSDFISLMSLLFNTYSFVFCIKIVEFASLANFFERSIYSNNKNISNYIKLIITVITILMIINIFACLFYLIGQKEIENNLNSWISNKNLFQEDWKIRYLNSLFYLFYPSLLNNISVYEQTFFVFFVPFLAFAFLYLISFMNALYLEIFKEERKISNKIKTLNDYMDRKEIKEKNRKLALCYLLDHINSKKQVNKMKKESKVLDFLSHDLKRKIISEGNYHLKPNLKMFSSNFSKMTAKKLLSAFEEKLFLPEESIHSKPRK